MFPVTSAFELPGMRVERSLGITFGLVVRSMGFSKAVTGGISSLRQGEVSQFTVVLEDARRHAIDRMIENARLLGANAVIAMRFDSSEIGKARAEVVAYGTAVVAAQLQTARSLPRYAQATAPCRDESDDRASANRSPESFINGLVFTLKGLTLGW
jgi:uncharacterized protein YbjQ (UPF0145 family)